MNLIFETIIPVKTISEANCSQNWRVKHKRHEYQKTFVKIAFMRHKGGFNLPVHIKLTRISMGTLDHHDNLRMALKWIADGCAEQITGDFVPGRADSNKGITWEYDQIKGRPQAVKIEIFSNQL